MKKRNITKGMAALLGAVLGIFASCGNETESVATASGARALQGLSATIAGNSTGTRATRAASSEPLYVGREKFVGGDKIKMTKFMRTDNSIQDFTYTDEDWQKTSDDAGWTRVSEEKPIYWSDAASNHTFIGYSLPYADFSWTKDDDGTYHGQLTLDSDGTEKLIDYTNYTETSADAGTTTAVSGNGKLKKDDVLLTYSTTVVPDATGIATIGFRHGLACVTVVLNISGFSTTAGVGDNEKDNSTRVTQVELLDQPYKYKWNQLSDAVTLEDETSTATVKAWTNSVDGDATGRDRRFYYHTLAVPGTRSEMDVVFTVTYHDPNNTSRVLTNTYTAKATDVKLEGGKRTLVNISLNHLNEEMTVGTEYIDWEFSNTPDEADLHKNSIYLSSTDEKNVVYHDKVTVVDDAVWLYTDKSGLTPVVYDIYGNDGSEEKPYSIATADQLLCLAYEVNNGKMDFEGKYILLDANLYMQASTSGTDVLWMGIGNSAHPFQGHFMGGLHSISRLSYSSLFGYIGSEGTVEGVNLASMLGTKNGGSVAENNAGTITGCAVNGDVAHNTEVAGGICATNSGTISVCYHIGAVDTDVNSGTTGTIAGINTGTIDGKTCYAASGMKGSTIHIQCYYDTEFYSLGSEEDVKTWGKTSSDLMKMAFVTALNGNIGDSPSYEYKFSPSEFPQLVKK